MAQIIRSPLPPEMRVPGLYEADLGKSQFFRDYHEARRHAEAGAARGQAHGIEATREYGRKGFSVKMVPNRPEHRQGHELRMEIVDPPAPTQKSEARIPRILRGLAAIRELRKGDSDFAFQHAKRWALDHVGEDRAQEAMDYASHFARTYPNGEDEDGRIIDHPTAYRSWRQDQEDAAAARAPKPAEPAPAPKPRPRQKLRPTATGAAPRISWMHGRKPDGSAAKSERPNPSGEAK